MVPRRALLASLSLARAMRARACFIQRNLKFAQGLQARTRASPRRDDHQSLWSSRASREQPLPNSPWWCLPCSGVAAHCHHKL
jgi:hypothetical protein